MGTVKEVTTLAELLHNSRNCLFSAIGPVEFLPEGPISDFLKGKGEQLVELTGRADAALKEGSAGTVPLQAIFHDAFSVSSRAIKYLEGVSLSDIAGDMQDVYERDISDMQSAYQRLASFYSDMLDALCNRTPNLELSEISALKIVDRSHYAARSVRRAEGREIFCHRYEGAKVGVTANLDAVTDIASNLVVNAARELRTYSEEQLPVPRIMIGVRAWGNEVLFDFMDNAPNGVAKDMRDKLFDPYATGYVDRGGKGIGLASSRGLAKKMGGSLTYYPRERGSRFTLALPRSHQ